MQGCIIEWVDDCIVAGTPEMISEFRSWINKDFAIRDYGLPTDFVGMQVQYDRPAGTMKLFQQKYIEKMAARYGICGIETSQDLPTPMNYTVQLNPAVGNEPRADATEFRSIVGSLHFAAHSCRPDISATVSLLSRFLCDPTRSHLKQARHCLAYLYNTRKYGITYTRDATVTVDEHIIIPPNTVVGFADATWADDSATRKSQTGYVFLLNGAAVSWASQQQNHVAESSGEAEFRAYHAASKEARSLRKLNDEFYHHTQSTTSSANKTWTTIFSEKLTDQPPMLIYNDNKSTLQWLNNPCHHAKTKHIETPVLSVRRLVYEFKLLAAEYISTSVQVADVMTKPLGKTKHWIHTRIMLGGRLPCPKTSQSEGG